MRRARLIAGVASGASVVGLVVAGLTVGSSVPLAAGHAQGSALSKAPPMALASAGTCTVAYTAHGAGLSVSPASGPSGTKVTLSGTCFQGGTTVNFTIAGPGAATISPSSVVASGTGTFNGTFTTTETITATRTGVYTITATSASGTRHSGFTTFAVT